MADNKCDYCLYYNYDEELGACVCDAELDMDDLESLSVFGERDCPFFRINNEYKIVEKQN